MNGGFLASNGEPATTPVYSATNGGWNSATGVFTPTSGDPSASVTVGDGAHVFTDGSTTPTFVGRVTAVDSTTITVSTTAKAGTAPTTAGSGISINVGGAWAGPSGTSGFPFNFATGALKNAAGDQLRVNLKDDTTYSITAAISHTVIGPVTFQGYTTTFGDGGRANIDGGTSGASYTLLTLSGSGVAYTVLADLEFSNNGATGSATLVNASADARAGVFRCVFRDSRGSGLLANFAERCEAYACNKSNTSNIGAFQTAASGPTFNRCVAHDNSGSNTAGFYTQHNAPTFTRCIADSNGGSGFRINNVAGWRIDSCDAYSNGSHGLEQLSLPGPGWVINSNFVANGGYGVSVNSGAQGVLLNCGFGSGTAANTSGSTTGTGGMLESGTVTYTADTTPWADPANGDFRITSTQAKGTGAGGFLQTQSGYGGTVGYPDIGAAQHQDSGGGSVIVIPAPGRIL